MWAYSPFQRILSPVGVAALLPSETSQRQRSRATADHMMPFGDWFPYVYLIHPKRLLLIHNGDLEAPLIGSYKLQVPSITFMFYLAMTP